MTDIELKKSLIHQIVEINDISFLKAIKTILDTKSKNEILVLTSEQRSEIVASQKDLEQGLFIENEILEEEIELWLSEK